MSVLQAIESQESKNPLVNKALQACQKILSNGKFITFCWLPRHKDIRGNEDADRAAKDALSKAQPENFELPRTDIFMKTQPFVSSLWQERWDEEVDNKLHAIIPQIDEKYSSGCTNRKDEVIINRIRMGHTRLPHTIPHLQGCFCPWTFFENIGFNTVLTDPFMSHLATQLGYSAGEFQALQLIVLAAFGVVD